MHPVCCKVLVVGALTLGNLVLMVREYQILASGMNINLLAQVAFGHNGALNMPARTSVAPRRLPERLPFLFRLPEHEIVGVFLAFLTGDLDFTESGLKLIQVLMGQLSVFLKGTCPEVHGPVPGHIGVVLVDKGLYHLQHAADFLGCLRMDRGRLYIHGCHVLFALLNVPAGHSVSVHTFLNCLFYDFVIHIREIGYIAHVVTLILKIPAYRVKYNHGPGVSYMDEIIHRRAADVHLDLPRGQRNEFLFFSAQCVKYLHTLILLK